MPATSAFCTISNDARPLTQQDVIRQRQRSRQQHAADHLVDRVVPADVLGDVDQDAVAVEQPGGVQAAGLDRTPSARARSRVGQRRQQVRRERTAAARAPGDRTVSDSIVRRPHRPHDEFVVTCRRRREQPLDRPAADPSPASR